MQYKIVLVPFPFDDLSATKMRPAVCLTNPVGLHRHVVLAFITSQRVIEPLASDLVLDADDPDFAKTGLRVTSTLRLHRMLTATTTLIQRELGHLSPKLQVDVRQRLLHLFDLSQ